MKATSVLAAAALVGATSLATAQSVPQATGPDHSTVQNSSRNQSADQRAENGTANKGSNKDAVQSDASQASIRQQMVNDLQQAGFTDVKVRPQSFFVEAKDRSGNPVSMFVGPNTFAEVKTVGANAQKATSNTNSSSNSANAASDRPGGAFTSVPPKDGLSSQLMGLQVYNNAKQDIGTIKDVALNENGIDGYILSVGGFLGIGDHYVAVRPSAINLKFDHAAKKWSATMDTTADQLKSAPEFKYPNNG
ncbi:PRC-barrel domain-containing protein [Bradyrhizobium sp. 192]|uniref:PRC-barrel domain-containing protein n=1 Tax=Bradyrhizobium sp. 192 TaxID=2782660 RepID=UPI001FFE9F9E|nr:PRC-barrel domain-containing protein [Bradyrhizobium sp. 192]UPJ56924.1 PRC-barrel domain-containing protein [Bradyrhizobium sp. 192]